MNAYFTTTGLFVIRQPLYPICNIVKLLEESTKLSELYTSDKFKRSLLWVSSDLYKEYKKYINGRLNAKDIRRMSMTLLKYAIRMSIRSTPFGEFASVGIGIFSEFTNVNSIGKRKRWVSLDSIMESVLVEHINSIEIANCKDSFKLALNGTLIRKGAYMHFMRCSAKGKQCFSILKFNQIIQALYRRVRNVYSLNGVSDIIFKDTDIDDTIRQSFILNLIQSNILVPICRPEAMEKNWIERVRPKNKDSIIILESIRKQLTLIESSCKTADEIERCISNIKESIPSDSKEFKNVVQSVSYSMNTQSISRHICQKIIDAIPFFSKISSVRISTFNLSKFKQDFKKRYELQSKPLLEVLNPEIGIGYGNTVIPKVNDLLVNIDSSITLQQSEFILRDNFEILLNHKIKDFKGKSICLTDDDVKDLEYKIKYMPASMSAVFNLIGKDDDILSELHFSGCSATCLIGRFTLGNRKIHNLAEKIANHEQSYYGDSTIIAEINLLPNTRSGNVNYRSRFRKYRICSVKTNSPYDIPLSSLYVSIENEIVRLKDVKSGKYVIPRLSSAHNNYAGTDAVYQFLGDIQSQSEIGSMMFSWGNLRYMYSHFPRVYYKDIILCLEEWSLNLKNIKENGKISIDKYIDWIKQNNLPRYVKLIDGDNELLVDHYSEQSVMALLTEIKNRSIIYLREYPEITMIKGYRYNKYSNQIIMPILKYKNDEK